MKTVLDKESRKVLYAITDDIELIDGEIAVDELVTEIILKPFYNFESKSFYETATKEEVEQFKKDNEI
jgi:hypothetical protein